ncbi:MAG TPA: thioesterase family protein [Xanthomonadaceae bacterium]|nr:thioesterase family protein [Xanthomonadaceae bacterium]
MFIRTPIHPPPPPARSGMSLSRMASPTQMPDTRSVAASRFTAGWGDMDFNGHMRNTAYLDKAADARLRFFARNGFPMEEFQRQGFGPVVQRDCIHYYREVRLLESIEVGVELAGLSPSGDRFVIRNTFQRDDGVLLARVDSAGGWLDLRQRRLIAPPADLLDALRSLPRCKDFEVLAPSIKQAA